MTTAHAEQIIESLTGQPELDLHGDPTGWYCTGDMWGANGALSTHDRDGTSGATRPETLLLPAGISLAEVREAIAALTA